jgi:hypothetical protein
MSPQKCVVYYETRKRKLHRRLLWIYGVRKAWADKIAATGELPNVKLTEHLKNVFSFHFFENLFLGGLLDFLS